MAISVEGYGNITQGNAKEIYLSWKRGEIDLNKSQQTKCEAYLSPEDYDEIQYDEQVTTKKGADKISTTDKDGNSTVKDNGNAMEGTTTGISATASAGSILGVIGAMKIGKATSGINGFCAVLGAALAVGCAAIAMGLSFAFDSDLKNRNDHSNNADNDNQTLDTYSESLGNTMEMMNEDVEHYTDTQNQLTTSVNIQTSQGAELQMEYDAAMAAGDVQGAQKAKEQMKALEKTDNSALEDDLAETGGALEEYRAMNDESAGCSASGQTVSDFLKLGHEKGKLANTNAILCYVGGAIATVALALAAIPKLPFALDGVAGISASVTWGVVAGLMMGTGGVYSKKANEENKCGSKGDEMQDHINTLNDMIDQQTQYTDDTESQFADSDEAAAKSKDGANKAAGEAVSGNKEKLNKMEKDDEESGVGAGGGGGGAAA